MIAVTPTTGQLLKQTPGYVAKATRYAVNDILCDPTSLKREGFIVASFVQAALRITLGWINEKHTQDPGQKDLRFREAIRTTLREIMGVTFSYVVLRKVESLLLCVLNYLQNVKPQPNKTPIGFNRLCRDVSQLWTALAHKHPLPVLTPTRLEQLEKTASFVPDMTSTLGRWFTRQTQQGLLKGKNPARLMALTREWLPVSVGTVIAVSLSGFWLEWLTINKSEKIVNFTSGQIKKHRFRPKRMPDFNVNEFVGGVMEERWRRQQVDDPWFAGHKPGQNDFDKTA